MPFGGAELGLLVILWLLAIIDCIFNKKLAGQKKLVWLLAIIFTVWFGALAYAIMSFITWIMAKDQSTQTNI